MIRSYMILHNIISSKYVDQTLLKIAQLFRVKVFYVFHENLHVHSVLGALKENIAHMWLFISI